MVAEKEKKIAVIAIGGNSLIKDQQHQRVEDQYEAVRETTGHIAHLVQNGWDMVISHGNGPQVGFILRRSEVAARVEGLHEVPLEVCGADTQGAIGYALQQTLYNHFQERGISRRVVTVVTQTEVSADDPAFEAPSKPIGSFMEREEAERRAAENGWRVAEDAGRGWRRIVPSPTPIRIVEEDSIRTLLDSGMVTIAAGGGGIPVVADEAGCLHGVPAVIDKDLASALLANAVGAELLIISTAVDKVALHFGRPEQRWLDAMTLEEARRHLGAGVHFARGSMAPKIQAAINFLEGGGRRVIITNPENIKRALAGESGTHIVHGS